MNKPNTITINQLSKDELLSLLYNNFNTQVNHPCFCACCGRSRRLL